MQTPRKLIEQRKLKQKTQFSICEIISIKVMNHNINPNKQFFSKQLYFISLHDPILLNKACPHHRKNCGKHFYVV